jgi:ribosomal protein S19E (S16A)
MTYRKKTYSTEPKEVDSVKKAGEKRCTKSLALQKLESMYLVCEILTGHSISHKTNEILRENARGVFEKTQAAAAASSSS